MDGTSRQAGVGVGLQVRAPTGERIKQAIRLGFPASNNETKYEAFLVRIDLAQSVCLEKLIICSDSQLVMGKIKREYETRNQRMVRYACLGEFCGLEA